MTCKHPPATTCQLGLPKIFPSNIIPNNLLGVSPNPPKTKSAPKPRAAARLFIWGWSPVCWSQAQLLISWQKQILDGKMEPSPSLGAAQNSSSPRWVKDSLPLSGWGSKLSEHMAATTRGDFLAWASEVINSQHRKSLPRLCLKITVSL